MRVRSHLPTARRRPGRQPLSAVDDEVGRAVGVAARGAPKVRAPSVVFQVPHPGKARACKPVERCELGVRSPREVVDALGVACYGGLT
eukprot:scaffold52375_cov72-Phaeocystis_antarctica.AAC.5